MMASTAQIVLLHGIIEAFDPARPLVDRTLVERRALERYLGARPRFVTWGELPNGSGDILTIDDSTRAGADACRLAIRLGHAVTFFVNPQNIVHREAYFFTILSAAIDATRRATIRYRDVDYPLFAPSMRSNFRRAMKGVLLGCPNDETREHELTRIVDSLAVGNVVIPEHHQPITLDELRDLRDLGVRIENHGWDHIEIGRLSDDEFREHVEQGRQWLRTHLGVPADSYAVPFGNTFVPSFQRHVSGAWFLATRDAPAARCSDRCWNRVEISDDVQVGTM